MHESRALCDLDYFETTQVLVNNLTEKDCLSLSATDDEVLQSGYSTSQL